MLSVLLFDSVERDNNIVFPVRPTVFFFEKNSTEKRQEIEGKMEDEDGGGSFIKHQKKPSANSGQVKKKKENREPK